MKELGELANREVRRSILCRTMMFMDKIQQDIQNGLFDEKSFIEESTKLYNSWLSVDFESAEDFNSWAISIRMNQYNA